jgi:hypothetical protein
MARIPTDARNTVKGKESAEPILTARFHCVQMGNGDRLSPLFDGCSAARGLPRGGAESFLP